MANWELGFSPGPSLCPLMKSDSSDPVTTQGRGLCYPRGPRKFQLDPVLRPFREGVLLRWSGPHASFHI